MNKGRLIIEATSCDGRPSGALRRHLELWPRVLPTLGARLEVTFLVSPVAEPQFRAALPGANIIAIPRTPAGALGRLRVNRLLRAMAGRPLPGRALLVHQETLPLALPRATLFCRHDARIFAPELSSLPRRLYADLRLPVVLRDVRRIISVSASGAAELGVRLGLVADHFSVVPNGVDAAYFATPIDLAARLEGLDLEPGGYRLVLGHRERRKNPLFAVELEALLMAAGLPGRLVVAGRATRERDFVERRVAQLGPELADRVRIIDTPDEERRLALLAGAGLVLVPSLVEGFSMVTLEALAAGAPLLCSDIAAHLEIAGAPFCQPLHLAIWREAALRLFRSAEDRASQRAAGAARVAHWTWEAAAAAMIALLEEQLGTP